MRSNSPEKIRGLLTAAAIGIGEGGAHRLFGAQMIEPRPMAGHGRFDLAQRGGAGKLPKQQGDQLIAGRELAHEFIAPRACPQADRRPPRGRI
jgi:hypothetical protein